MYNHPVSAEPDSPPQPRMDYAWASPDAVKAMLGLELYLRDSGIDPVIRCLVQVRCSQINGCAFCLDMHTRDARKSGVSDALLHAVAAWNESPLFSGQQRAALAWAENVTLVSTTHVPDDVYNWVSKHFEGKELVDLTMAVVAINGWNRLAVSFRKLPNPS